MLRQIRIEGHVEPVEDSVADDYYEVGRERVRLVHGHQNNRSLSMTGQRCLSAWSAFNSSSTDGLCHGHHTERP